MSNDPTDPFSDRHSKNNNAWEEVWQLLGNDSLGIEKEVDTELRYRSGMEVKTGDERSGTGTEDVCQHKFRHLNNYISLLHRVCVTNYQISTGLLPLLNRTFET